jgi:membrane-associated phospholipid phosphatase
MDNLSRYRIGLFSIIIHLCRMKLRVNVSGIIILMLLSAGVFAQNPDIELLRKINLNRNRSLDPAFRFVSDATAPVAFGLPVVMFGTGLLLHDSLTIQRSLYIGGTLATAAIITTALKYSINRSRPFTTYPDIEKAGDAGSPSFPSGHTSDAFALATSLSISFPKWYVIVPAYAWGGTVAWARMDLGVHYPSDVLAGALTGAGSAVLCHYGQLWINGKLAKRKNRTNH